MLPFLIPLALGAIQSGVGLYQQLHAASQANKNQRPEYDIPMEYYKDLNLAQQRASRGLPSQALSTYYDNIGQQQAGSLNALLQMGGDPNQVNQIYGTGVQASQELLAKDAMAKDANINALQDAYLRMGDQKNQEWLINKYQPYADKAEQYSQDKQAGFQNFFGGLDTAATSFATNATSKLAAEYEKMMNGGGQKVASNTTDSGFTPSGAFGNNQTGFDQYDMPPQNLNLGENNLSYGLPDYSLFGQPNSYQNIYNNMNNSIFQ